MQRRSVSGLVLHSALTLLAAAASFAALAWAMSAALVRYYGWGHPDDASVGDVAGWALVILSPVLLPAFGLCSCGCGLLVWRRLGRIP